MILNMKKNFVGASLLLLLSCEDNAVEPASGVLKIRVQNLTDYALSEIVVNTSGGKRFSPASNQGESPSIKISISPFPFAL